LLVVVACSQSSQNEEQNTFNPPVPADQPVNAAVSAPQNEFFTASISVPSKLKSKEEFTIKATLKNLSDHDIRILHGSDVFEFTIADSNGKRVNTVAMTDMGIIRTIQGNGAITEQYVYKLEKPGFYEVSAIARIKVYEGETEKNIEVETNKAKFELIR
jgi:hypothetical protein